jgi:6-phospho-beta-glucosidase
LPDDAVIETPCIVNATGFWPIRPTAPPPKAVWGLVCAVKNYERLTVEAAVSGCRDTALLALMAHPLVRDYDTACKLLPDLLVASKAYLPQFH